MIFSVTTIPQILIVNKGNLTDAARRLNCNRATVRKYVDDTAGRSHSVVNGVLMVSTIGRDKS